MLGQTSIFETFLSETHSQLTMTADLSRAYCLTPAKLARYSEPLYMCSTEKCILLCKEWTSVLFLNTETLAFFVAANSPSSSSVPSKVIILRSNRFKL